MPRITDEIVRSRVQPSHRDNNNGNSQHTLTRCVYKYTVHAAYLLWETAQLITFDLPGRRCSTRLLSSPRHTFPKAIIGRWSDTNILAPRSFPRGKKMKPRVRSQDDFPSLRECSGRMSCGNVTRTTVGLAYSRHYEHCDRMLARNRGCRVTRESILLLGTRDFLWVYLYFLFRNKGHLQRRASS